MTAERLLTQSEVAARFQVSPRTVEAWRLQGRIRFVRTPGGRVRFLASDVDALIQGDLNPSPISATLRVPADSSRTPSKGTK